ncbi:MAG: hypothetical protein IT582_02770, partial [Opitutaceae bacterium]|nr:hypothetical protein [Opitutaceae bacterium]
SHVPTRKSGEYQTVNLAADYMRQLNRDWVLIGAAALEAQHVVTFDALNHIGGTGTLKLHRKFGLGPYAPVLELSSALAIYQFDETSRSGWQFTGGIGIAKRFTDMLRLSARAAAVEYLARRELYDASSRELVLEGDWDITDRWRLSLGGGRRWGEYLANAAWKIWAQAIDGQVGPVIQAHYRSLPWEVTNTYGPGWVAYRVRDSHTDLWWAELSPALTDQTSLALRYEFARVTNAVGIKYDLSYWTVGVHHQF